MAVAEKLHYWWACVNISLAVELLVDRGISTVLYGITEVRIIIWKCCRHFGGYWLHILVMLAVLRSSRVYNGFCLSFDGISHCCVVFKIVLLMWLIECIASVAFK